MGLEEYDIRHHVVLLKTQNVQLVEVAELFQLSYVDELVFPRGW